MYIEKDGIIINDANVMTIYKSPLNEIDNPSLQSYVICFLFANGETCNFVFDFREQLDEAYSLILLCKLNHEPACVLRSDKRRTMS